MEVSKAIRYSENRINCEHVWKKGIGSDSIPCYKCELYPELEKRLQCELCFTEACTKCVGETSKSIINPTDDKEQSLLKRISKLEDKINDLEKLVLWLISA